MARGGQFTVANRVITHINPETGETKSTAFLINPVTSPRQIDLITADDRMLPGIYRFDDDGLVVCYTNRHGHGRPTDFASTEGSNRILIRLKVSEAPVESKAAFRPGSGHDTGRGEQRQTRERVENSPRVDHPFPRRRPRRRPTESQLRVDRELLAGNWDILSIQDNGEKLSSDIIRSKIAEDGRVRIGGRGMSIVSPRNEEKRLWAYRIDPAQTPKQIDITTQFDTVLKGIYTFNGDELRICVAKTEDAPRPSEFRRAPARTRCSTGSRWAGPIPRRSWRRSPSPPPPRSSSGSASSGSTTWSSAPGP